MSGKGQKSDMCSGVRGAKKHSDELDLKRQKEALLARCHQCVTQTGQVLHPLPAVRTQRNGNVR